ncbi:hypothetical protein EJ04DRAFT_5621 [Polyplosphaeria fusca]|uniref:Uncharacterized protein n=1 Tax=Polyplosphaeria fusca TaxID=682080 RepID=A0A9P4RD92_9PLEO|nr:hypothetical protein EJ04DRAFT_5621 [Polyplosphaeria fusca]
MIARALSWRYFIRDMLIWAGMVSSPFGRLRRCARSADHAAKVGGIEWARIIAGPARFLSRRAAIERYQLWLSCWRNCMMLTMCALVSGSCIRLQSTNLTGPETAMMSTNICCSSG